MFYHDHRVRNSCEYPRPCCRRLRPSAPLAAPPGPPPRPCPRSPCLSAPLHTPGPGPGASARSACSPPPRRVGALGSTVGASWVSPALSWLRPFWRRLEPGGWWSPPLSGRGGAHGGLRPPPCLGRHSSYLPRVPSVFPGSCLLLSGHSLLRMCWPRSQGTGEGPRVDAGVTLATLRPPRGFCRVVGFFPSPPVWCIFKQILFFKEEFL